MLSIPYLGIHATDHCNLNCLDCNHFAPYRSQKTYLAEDYLPWLDILLKQIKVDRIGISGGEPFLNKNIIDFIKKIKTRVPTITLLTNGFWLKSEKSIHKYKEIFPLLDTIRFTKYEPIMKKIGEVNFDALVQKIEKNYKIEIHLIPLITKFISINFDKSINPTSNCLIGGDKCQQLLTNGKLMKCFIGYSIFSTKNNNKVFFDSKNHIEMFYDLKNPTETLEKWLTRFPFDACHYCYMGETNAWKFTTNKLFIL